MENQIFRKKSLERISSPEKLDDYLKVSTPSLWMILLAVIVLLVGIFIWASVGRLETTIDAVVSIESKQGEIVLTGKDAEKIKSGMPVRIDESETEIKLIKYDELGRAIALCDFDVPDGNYKVKIVTESIHPISFLFR